MSFLFDQFGRLNERWISPRVTRGFFLALIPILVASAVTGIFLKDNDFQWHYAQGQKVLEEIGSGAAEAGTLPKQYFLSRMLFDSALALLPYRLARAISWMAGVGVLIFSLRTWGRIIGREPPRWSAIAVLAVWWVLPFLHRDLDECGLQIFTLGMFSAGAAALVERRWVTAGVWMALAASYKTSPLLVLPYLLYKRLWREAGVMIVALVLVNGVLPIPFFGWQQTLEAGKSLVGLAVYSAASGDPEANGVETPKHQNSSLKLALVRFLQTFPPEHPLFLAKPGQKDSNQQPVVPVAEIERHWAFFQFFDLDPSTVKIVVAAVFALFGLRLAWAFRASGGDTPNFQLARELALLAVLSAVLSPFCWKQHLVMILPIVMVVLRDSFCTAMGRWHRAILILVWCCIWLPQRDILGRELSVAVASYKLPTLACLALIFLALQKAPASKTD